MEFAAFTEAIVDKYAFLTGRAFETSAKEQRNVLCDREANLCSTTRGRIGYIPFDLDSSQLAHHNSPCRKIASSWDHGEPDGSNNRRLPNRRSYTPYARRQKSVDLIAETTRKRNPG